MFYEIKCDQMFEHTVLVVVTIAPNSAVQMKAYYHPDLCSINLKRKKSTRIRFPFAIIIVWGMECQRRDRKWIKKKKRKREEKTKWRKIGTSKHVTYILNNQSIPSIKVKKKKIFFTYNILKLDKLLIASAVMFVRRFRFSVLKVEFSFYHHRCRHHIYSFATMQKWWRK